MFWWIVGIVLALIVLGYAVARISRGRAAAPKRQAGTRPAPRPSQLPKKRPGTRTAPKITTGPQPGEIWWADVPYEDGTGHKVRPCLIVRNHGETIEVLKITSQDQSHRRDHVEIATRHWDADAGHNSFLDLTDPIAVRASAFEDKAGTLDAPTWTKVRQLHNV